jgi:LacI family transcriptional regulator
MKNGKAERKLTIKDIAREAGVSITTASFVMNGQDAQYGIKAETAERVREVIRKNKFRPNYGARILKTGRSHTLAFIAPSITDGFYNEIVVSIETTALQAGYQLVLCNSLDNAATEEIYLRNLIERQVDGIVLVPIDPQAGHLDLLEQAQIKTILFCPPEKAANPFYCVDFDLSAAPRLAVEQLLASGCKRIVLLDWRPTRPRASSWARNRTILRNIFLETLRKHDIEGGKTQIWTLFGEEENPQDAEIFQQMLREQKPDAIVAMRNIQLLRAWHALMETGLAVPKDIRLVGCDDLMTPQHWSPALTSMGMPKEELGKHVVEILLDGTIQAGSRIFPIELIKRDSSA